VQPALRVDRLGGALGLSKYPLITWYPRVQISPIWPSGAVCPVAGSTILTSVCGNGRPTVSAWSSGGSLMRVAVMTGEASVWA